MPSYSDYPPSTEKEERYWDKLFQAMYKKRRQSVSEVRYRKGRLVYVKQAGVEYHGVLMKGVTR